MAKSGFAGFPPQTLKFLADLKKNNDRDWFADNRDRYEEHLLAPSLAYIEAMQKPLAKISPLFQAVPKKIGGSLMRIFRDVRFSKDKSLYKTNIGIHFRHEAGCDVHAPGFYVHIEPKECFFGVGTWHPAGDALKSIRDAIDTQPTDWKKAKNGKAFRERFDFAGDSLKRPPKGYDADHPLIDDLKRKDFIVVQSLDARTITQPDFVKQSTDAFKAAVPFTRFLCNAIGVGF